MTLNVASQQHRDSDDLISRLDEQSRQFKGRRERLAGERQGLALPDAGRLAELQQQTAAADEAKAVADERVRRSRPPRPRSTG